MLYIPYTDTLCAAPDESEPSLMQGWL